MNWLIKLLGGYTAEEYLTMEGALRHELRQTQGVANSLCAQLREAQKNDHRDDKGRYTASPKPNEGT